MPLIDINANNRQPGCKSTTRSSKIPGPEVALDTVSENRYNPFIASPTEPSCHIPQSIPSRTSMSPSVGSKIPRKALAPTHISMPKRNKNGIGHTPSRGVLPKSRGGGKPTASALSNPTSKLRSSTNRNKPLPSPPVAQIVDPNSPPKAQRTLVDAEAAGTPSEEEWPILRPENVLPPKSNAKDDESFSSSSRHVAGQESNGQYYSPARIKHACSELAVSPPGNEAEQSFNNSLAAHNTHELRTLGFLNKPPEIGYAISTEHDEAVESPLARKKSSCGPNTISPRIGSKRSSLPLSTKPQSASRVPTPSSRPRPQQAKLSDTKWPLLNTTTRNDSRSARVQSLAKHNTAIIRNLPVGQVQAHSLSESADTSPSVSSQLVSAAFTSTWSMAAGSSLDDEPEQEFNSSTRVKRLSSHSTTSGLGPVLKIADDADKVLLGRSDSIPDVPALSDTGLEKPPLERSLSALAGRISRQTMSKMSLSLGSRSPTPHSAEADSSTGAAIKINPIRSMQPARKISPDASPKMPSSTTIPSLQDFARDSKLPSSSLTSKHEVLSNSQTREASELKNIIREPSPFEGIEELDRSLHDDIKADREDPATPSRVPFKADQVLGISIDSPPSSRHKQEPVSRNSPSYGLSKSKMNAAHSKTSPSFVSEGVSDPVARKDSPKASAMMSSPTSTPLASSRHARSRTQVSSPHLSKLKSSESTTPDRNSEKTQPAVTAEDLSKRRSRSNSAPPSPLNRKGGTNLRKENSKHTNPSMAKIKEKRSFRDFFHKRNGKYAEKEKAMIQPKESKRASLTGSTLAKKFRHSANFSKVHLPKMPDPDPMQRPYSKASRLQTQVQEQDTRPTSSANIKAPTSVLEARPVTRSDTGTVINTIINRVSSLPPTSPDRLRGLEIAEAVLHAVEMYKAAELSSVKAKQHAREAELHAERAGVELDRLEKLCEPDFDDETLQALKELIKSSSIVRGMDDGKGTKDVGVDE